MNAGWVAAGVRGRGLCRRRLGPVGAGEVAAAPSLAEAITRLAGTSYGPALRRDMGLAAAQRAVSATSLWHLRILAGWGPPTGASPLRCLAAGFELANVSGRLRELAGGPPPGRTYELGSLATAWSAVSSATTLEAVRAALAGSVWGDPGAADPDTIRLALELAWARRVADGAPGAGDWAVAAAALVIARVLAAGAAAALTPPARRDAGRLLGGGWERATAVDELAGLVPPAGARVLHGVTGPADLWSAQVRWWLSLEETGRRLVAGGAGAAVAAGVVAVLGADAWRVRAALAVAEHGGGDLAAFLGPAAEVGEAADGAEAGEGTRGVA